jgi:hypothetical protein
MQALPTPTGPYPIGTFTRRLVDARRREIFTTSHASPRELLIQVWYPAGAQSAPSDAFAPYVDDPRALEPLAALMGLPRTAFAAMAGVPTHAVRDAPVAGDGSRYPVVLYSHGRCGQRGNNTFQVEELASHGYVVVTIDHPYVASGVRFPDGPLIEFDTRLLPPWPRRILPGLDAQVLDNVIPFLVEDLLFVRQQLEQLDGDPAERLHGRLDLGQIGLLAVSLSGITAAKACARDPGFAAALIMDAWVPRDVVAAGLRQPVMWITRDPWTMRREGWDEEEIVEVHATIRATLDRLPGDGYLVLVPGMYHVDFSDGRLLSPLIEEREIAGPIDGRIARTILRDFTSAFFDRHLKGRPARLLEDLSGPPRDFSFERHRPALAA